MSMVCKGMLWGGMLAFVLALSGCPGDEGEDGADGVDNATASTNDNGGDDGHEDEGHSHADPPHGGVLIELGSSDYHGEFLHEDDSVTIFILDADASEQVAIDAELITLNVTHDGESKQYELTPAPDEGDEEGKSSRFTLEDAELVEALEAEGTTARVNVKIDDTPYTGDIPHDHGHSHD